MNKLSNEKSDDWRRQGQKNYLYGANLVIRDYCPPSPKWDHDHCEFCFITFSLQGEDLKRGYSTKDAHWICEDCFNEFHNEFNWSVSDCT